MSITIQLKPELEARLLAQASKQEVSVEQLLETLIEGCVVSLEQEQEKPDHMVDLKNRLAILNELGKSPSLAKAPSLLNEAISRESIYREREDAQL